MNLIKISYNNLLLFNNLVFGRKFLPDSLSSEIHISYMKFPKFIKFVLLERRQKLLRFLFLVQLPNLDRNISETESKSALQFSPENLHLVQIKINTNIFANPFQTKNLLINQIHNSISNKNIR
ncbi:hypothetical protein FRX31_030853 [Thalictrum thalictroides]|uniref:Uncharacterized protein n=1 Tax=Thalictrum thalictroides TaxID=46969 RepID=A0A7J6V5V5_THATH|nr:hypothetical protein FRX31_030853 [Thalictrum thalictroides]